MNDGGYPPGECGGCGSSGVGELGIGVGLASASHRGLEFLAVDGPAVASFVDVTQWVFIRAAYGGCRRLRARRERTTAALGVWVTRCFAAQYVTPAWKSHEKARGAFQWASVRAVRAVFRRRLTCAPLAAAAAWRVHDRSTFTRVTFGSSGGQCFGRAGGRVDFRRSKCGIGLRSVQRPRIETRRLQVRY